MARKLSFINYKGGVGKTSLVVNVSALLSRMGKRVLVVDLDAQSNSSVWLMRLDRWNALTAGEKPSLRDLFFRPGEVAIDACIERDVVRSREGQRLLPGLDLLPTTFEFFDLEHEYRNDPKLPYYKAFSDKIAAIEHRYDYILYDCPPNVLRASECALFASDGVLVPANPDALSLIGLTLLVQKIGQFHETSAAFRSEGHRPALVEGVIFNGLKSGVNFDVPKLRMLARLKQFKAAGKVSSGAEIYASGVRDAVIVRRAVTMGLPLACLSLKDGADGVLDDYMAVTKRLDNPVLTF